MAGRGGRLEQGLGGEVAARAPAEAFGVLDAAGFLEDVDDGVAVAAKGERAPRRGQRPGRGQAVAEVALGGGAQAPTWVACTTVVRGPSTSSS
jgi:hypothetical protein